MKTQPRSSQIIQRSFDVYYRDRERAERMHALHRAFVAPDSLAFDIGAHVGDRTGSFLKLGARVVAVEPQSLPFRALRLLYGRNPKAELVHAAVGDAEGSATLFLNRANPTVSTLSEDFIHSASAAEGWRGQTWDEREAVSVTTLDSLIDRHGQPAFVKIDVEGHEEAVLQGLNMPVPALSFEFTTMQKTAAERCLTILGRLGAYEFNISIGEEHRLRHAGWLTNSQIADEINALPDSANSGDVFARLR